MTCQPQLAETAIETPAPQDVIDLLRTYARAARKTRREMRVPPRAERMSILAEARASLDRINASPA